MSHPFIPVANVASVELIYSVLGVVCENVIHVRKGSPYSFADLQAVRTIVNAWDAASWFNTRSTGFTLNRIRSKALDTSSSPIEDFFLPTPRGGGMAGTQLPSNATFAVKLSTGLAGRSFRGRLYVVGFTAAATGPTANQITSATASDWVARLNVLLANLASGGHTLGVVSYRTAGAYRAAGLFTPATSWVAVDLNVDSMRRRLTGRGI